MIIKNAIVGNTEDVTVIEMGKGDVLMLGSHISDELTVHLGMKTLEEPLPINEDLPHLHFETYDDFKPEVIFIFSKPESIDSLIHVLERCKEELNKIK